MPSLLEKLRELTWFSISIRLFLAALCGGCIGLERGYKRRPAGFRTHILICLGAAMTALTSQYLSLVLHAYTDITRMSAQVVAGIGFIGAGTIIVTRRNRVKGLTTAAGLWATGIIGLCLGSGFLEGGILASLLILAAELFFSRLEYRFMNAAPELHCYIEYQGKETLDKILQYFKAQELSVLNMELNRMETEELQACVLFELRLNRRQNRLEKQDNMESLLDPVRKMTGVISVEELTKLR